MVEVDSRVQVAYVVIFSVACDLYMTRYFAVRNGRRAYIIVCYILVKNNNARFKIVTSDPEK